LIGCEWAFHCGTVHPRVLCVRGANTGLISAKARKEWNRFTENKEVRESEIDNSDAAAASSY
jgi:hypothetical protein